MNHSLLLAALFAALVSTSTIARANLLDSMPSTTVVHSDLVTVGSPSLDDQDSGGAFFEAVGRR